MVRKVRQKRSPLQRMWDLDITALSRHFQQAVQRTGLGRLRLTPHCARHGAASTDYALGHRTLGEIQRKCRWLVATSVRRYEKAGRLNKQVLMMTRPQLGQAEIEARRVPRFWD